MESASTESGFLPSRFGIGGIHPLRLNPPNFTPPVSKNFNFSASGLWKSNGNMQRWIADIPSVHHDIATAPAEFETRGEKRRLDSADEYGDERGDVDSDDVGKHYDKKAKTSSTLPGHSDLPNMRRRSRIVMSGKHVARKLSNRFSHIFSASSSQGYLGAPSVGSTASPPGTPTKPPASQRMRFAVVGDDNSGKTCMLLRFYRNSFCEDWNPTQYELFNKTILVDGQHVEVELWDMAGKIELHQLSLLSYLAWDAIFLCFSVNCERKFANAQTHWMDEIRKTCGDIPVVVVGTKIDTRIGSGSWAPLFPNMNTRISASEGAMAANGVGAIRYLECSAKTGHGVSHVFEEGVRSVRAFEAGPEASIREKNHGPGIGQLLCV